MTAAELIDRTRRKYLADTAEPYLWCDDELLDDLNWAYRRACYWSLAIRDSTTAAVCTITLAADQAVYALNRAIIKVNSIILNNPDTTTRLLQPVNQGEAARYAGHHWQTETGDPSMYVPNGYIIRLVRVPSAEWAGQTLTVDCFRLPLTSLAMDDTPEFFDDIQQESLIYGLLSQAFLKVDADAFRADLAKAHMGNFIAAFGPAVSHTTQMHNLRGTGGMNAAQCVSRRFPNTSPCMAQYVLPSRYASRVPPGVWQMGHALLLLLVNQAYRHAAWKCARHWRQPRRGSCLLPACKVM